MDRVRQNLGEAVARTRPDLTAEEQSNLIDQVLEFIDARNRAHSAPLKMVAVGEVQDIPSRTRTSDEASGQFDPGTDIGFAIICERDGTVTEVIRDGLGLGSRLASGSDLIAVVSPFHVRRATRFLRSAYRTHAAFDCALSVSARSGMVRLYCSGVSVDLRTVIVATREPLALSIPQELVRLAEKRPDALGTMLKELAVWRKHGGSVVPAASGDLTDRGQSATAEGEVRSRVAAAHSALPARRRLLELAAHDLRNPVSGILAACQYLMEDASRFLEPHHIVVLCSIESSTRLALQLIQNLAEIPSIRLSKPQLELQPTDIASVLQEAVAAVRSLADMMKVKVHVRAKEQGPAFRGDPIRLGEALSGLIVNAIGSAHLGGRVEIVTSVRADEVSIAVHREYADSAGRSSLPAPGESAPKNSPRKLSDVHAGLLLARAKRILKAHGGTVRAEIHGKQGNSWTVTLPLAAEQLARRQS